MRVLVLWAQALLFRDSLAVARPDMVYDLSDISVSALSR